ncbi:penicillin-binding protein 1A [Candidatus Trichorickettsia mobilis]|nr:penicillin-binding protein 1A [Candidatus Trichorickettsia mobilis]
MLKLLSFYFKLLVMLSLVAIAVAVYIVYHYSKDLPDYSQLANYHPPSVTRIYSRDGKLIEEYAVEHRVFVPIGSIPHSLIEAFIAAEDKNFFTHPGVDIFGIIRAAITNISNMLQHRRVEGGSTITQQVVKNFLLTPERSLERKIKEAILSYMISQTFTKEQILELYLNQLYLGHSAYGVAAAAQSYFNKSVEELNLSESALLAGLPKAPSAFNPEKNYARAKERRDYVISRMLEDGYITQASALEAIASPITLVKRDRTETVTAGYYAEKVRDEAVQIFGKEDFYKGGLTIITALDTKIQACAEQALRHGIREYDRKHGFHGKITNINLEHWQTALAKMEKPPSLLEYELAVVLEVSDKHAKIGLQNSKISTIPLTEMQWTGSNLKSAKSLLNKGDVIIVEAIKNNHELYGLRQIPLVNGGIIVLNPTTGEVLASLGGYDFSTSKFDRATQALRQPGSLSKTFVYLAALENNVQPNKIFTDGPIEINQGVGMPSWRPKNYKGDFLGEVTMRTGLEKSRNLVTVRVAQTVGLNKVAEIIKRFGINNEPKKVYSMVLGSIETTLEKMTIAYAIIANSGKKVVPKYIALIKDRNGKVIYRNNTEKCEGCTIQHLQDSIPPIIISQEPRLITDEASAYQITSMLTGVVERGTAGKAKKLGKIIAGKTGTTNDSLDTWFIGFTPRIVVGTYVGYDTPKTLGRTATGSSVALPIFIHFMENAYTDIPTLAFKVPESIRLVNIDQRTGLPMTNTGSITEAFKIHDIINELPDFPIEDNDVFHNLPTKDQSQEIY